MSNWIENNLTITKGDPAVLWDAIRGEHSPFDFNRLVPMPECLKNVPCGSQATLAYEYVTGKDSMAAYSRYPVSDFDQRAADISVDHPQVVENYRSAHEIALRFGKTQATTEDLRTAMIHYRSLFEELVQVPTIVERKEVA
jgi:hypothetical protein